MHLTPVASPGRAGARELRNRVIMSLFPTRMAKDGQVTEQMIEWYRARADGGAAALVVEAVCIDYPRSYKGGRQLRIDEPVHREGLGRLVRAIHDGGALAVLHLTYTANMAWDGAQDKRDLVDALSEDDIAGLIQCFARSAALAREAGFDGVEVQASYGDLIPTFMSALSNKRTDGYGGDLEGRGRFLTETVAACRSAVGPEGMVWVKYMADDHRGGFTDADAVALAPRIEAAGADLITVTSGDKKTKEYSLQPHQISPGVNVGLAAKVSRAVGIPVAAMGKIKSPALAEGILAEGEIAFLAMTRALLADPSWPAKVITGQKEAIRGCIGCLECANSRWGGARLCAVNPWVGREADEKSALAPAAQPKKVMVVGAGIAGMQFAATAARRGHNVVIYDSARRAGGTWRVAQCLSHKAELGELIRYLTYDLQELSVRRFLGHRVEQSDILAESPDVLVVATGSRNARPAIPGIENAVNARNVVLDGNGVGENVVVIGGGDTGAEVAELLAEHGHPVTIVHRGAEIATDLPWMNRQMLLARLEELDVRILTGHEVMSVHPGAVMARKAGDVGADDGIVEIACDSSVAALGAEVDTAAITGFREAASAAGVEEVLVIGDANVPGGGLQAVHGANEAALQV